MDQRERYDDFEEAIRTAQDGRQTRIWTALPGIIQSFNATAMTCVVQPALNGMATDQNNVTTNPSLPLLLDCPVVFPHGGGVSLTFPIAAGDECLVVFSTRAMDSWQQNGGTQNPVDARMHSLSDGFCIPGPYSQPKVLSNVSTTAAELRSDDHSTFVQLDPNGQTVNITAPGGWSLNGPGTINGNVNQTGAYVASGEGTFNGIEVSQHVHPGVEAGAASTEPPTG